VSAIHGDLTQKERERTLDAFRSGTLKILIARTSPRRGLHIEDISHVVITTCPRTRYLPPTRRPHRPGRQERCRR